MRLHVSGLRAARRVFALVCLASCATPPRETPPALAPPIASSAPPIASAASAPSATVAIVETPDAATTADPPCAPWRDHAAPIRLEEPGGARKAFSWHGYLARQIAFPPSRCVTVAWPAGETTTDGRTTTVAKRVGDAWLRAIENTLARLPPKQAAVVLRIVIDDRPTEHGIAAFDRGAPDDGRDGHTIWLHQRLFVEPNHWARGTHGAYWSYHANVDGIAISDQPAEHTLFSPVLLHEIGHLVSYAVATEHRAREEVVPCAAVCGDRPGGCRGLSDREREEGCVSAYCTPFKFETGTENWAEQFRFYFQSAHTRALLAVAKSPCASELAKLAEGAPAPWENGLPDVATFHKSRWKSCGERACKAF